MSDTEPADVPTTSRINFGASKAPVEQAADTVQAEAFEAEAEAQPEATVETAPYEEGTTAVPDEVEAPLPDETAPTTEAVPEAVGGWNGIPAGGLANDPEYQAELAGEAVAEATDVTEEPSSEQTVAADVIGSETDPAPTADEADAVEETAAALAAPVADEQEPVEPDAPVIEAPEPVAGPSVEEMQSERDRLDAEIKARTDAEKAAVIEQIKTVVQSYGITPDELVEALGGLRSKRKGVKAKTKYKDPVSGALWSGRGKAPAWIKGKDYTPFLIPENERV